MRKITAIILMVVIIMISTSGALAQEIETIENLDNGTARIRYESPNDRIVKLMVEKDGQRFFYDLDSDAESLLPLQAGDGNYRICILEQKEGNRYRVVESKRFEYIEQETNECFINPIDIIDWSEGDPVYKKALELTEGLATEEEKIMAVYNFVVDNFDYDYDKINRIANNYVPDPRTMLEEQSGICYDYSSAFAAMLRINGIPTRLVKGYRKGLDVYHAWNEVYDSDEDAWVTVDTTFDACYHDNGVGYFFEKDSSQYVADKIF